MTWNQVVRSVAAAARAAERDARRRQRELEKRQAQYEKMQALEQAAYDVECYENYLELLVSIHKECSSVTYWRSYLSADEPKEPSCQRQRETLALRKLESFAPGFMTKFFGSPERKLERLKRDLEAAKKADEEEYEAALFAYKQVAQERKDAKELARRVLENEPHALVQVMKEANPFSEIGMLGSELKFSISDDGAFRVTINVHGQDVVPKESKSITKAGKLSVKSLPKTTFYELYQDYVCSCVLRVARESFALLPIKELCITAVDDLLNTATGHIGEQPIVSAYIPRETVSQLNMETIDPSDSMANFIHNMDFKKTRGFAPVKEVSAPPK